jgi:hemolysin D
MKSPETIAELAPVQPGLPIRRYTRDELDFLPAAINLVERPASRLAQAITLLIMALVVSAVVWACVSRVDIVATADGKTVADGQAKTIQPLEIGTIRQILVRDGQHVTAAES